jgi:dimethylaniline monooxygenase (N-oxide forming)
VKSFGAAFTSFYRLVGPFRSDVAPQVIKTEIWDTITRRGIVGNVIMGIVPMSFYATLNLMAWALEKLLQLVGGGVMYS